MKKTFVLMITIMFLFSCKTTHIMTANVKNIEGQETSSKTIVAYNISYQKAIQYLHDIAETKYGITQARSFKDGIVVETKTFWKGNATTFIRPFIVMTKDKTKHGIVFKIEGEHQSQIDSPSFASEKFMEIFEEYANENNIPQITLTDYFITKDKGVTSSAPADFPRNTAELKNFVNNREFDDYEGIWRSHDSKYTLAIIKTDDALNNYIGYVLSSTERLWKKGDIKIKFNNLQAGEFSIATFWNDDKMEAGITMRAYNKLIKNAEKEPEHPFNLIKIYPTIKDRKTASKKALAVGTGWFVARNILVTNYHVIENAKSITVGLQNAKQASAKVLLSDERMDIAILETSLNRPALPLANNKAQTTGTNVFALGFPHQFTLGGGLKMTKGIISSQKGFKGDATRYQSSAVILGGNSGGPLINENGSVVGINVSGYNQSDSFNYAIKIPYLKILLDQLGVEYNSAGVNSQISGKDIFTNYEKSVLPIWVH